MLNERQLKDIAICNEFGTGCYSKQFKRQCNGNGVGLCQTEAAKTALAYREMLERLEYCAKDTDNGRIIEVCPMCEMHRHKGHDRDCALGKLLKGEE